MNVQKKITKQLLWICFSLTFIFLGLIIIRSEQTAIRWLAIGAISLLIICALLCWRYMRWMIERTELDKDNQFIQLYRLKRHDWMNDLQLMFAYIQLKKLDKLTECAENIKERLEQEGQWLSSGLPALEQSLLVFSSAHPEIPIQLEVQEGIRLEQANEQLSVCMPLIKTILQQCEHVIRDKEHEDSLAVEIHISKNSGKLIEAIEVLVKGKCDLSLLAEQLKHKIGQNYRTSSVCSLNTYENAVAVRIKVPYQTLAG